MQLSTCEFCDKILPISLEAYFWKLWCQSEKKPPIRSVWQFYILTEEDFTSFHKFADEFYKGLDKAKLPLPCTNLIKRFYNNKNKSKIYWESYKHTVKVADLLIEDVNDFVEWITTMRAKQ